MQDKLIDALESLKMEIQTIPEAPKKHIEHLILKIDRSLEAAKEHKMVRSLEILEGR